MTFNCFAGTCAAVLITVVAGMGTAAGAEPPIIQETFLLDANPDYPGGAAFGSSLAADPPFLGIGIEGHDDGAGRVRMGHLTAEGWTWFNFTGPSGEDTALGRHLSVSSTGMFASIGQYVAVGSGLFDVSGSNSGWFPWVQPSDTLNPVGMSAAVSGDTLAFGVPNSGQGGLVFIYEVVNNAWSLVQTLSLGNQAEHSGFGEMVAMDGDDLIVFEGLPSPQIYAYHRNSQGQFVLVSQFGNFVYGVPQARLDGDVLVLLNATAGLFYEPEPEPVRVYRRQPDDTWAQDSFPFTYGMAVDVAGDTIVVGNPEYEKVPEATGGRAVVYTYDHNEEEWEANLTLLPSNPQFGQRFGHSVAIYEPFVFVGAPETETLPLGAGSLYQFKLPKCGDGYADDGEDCDWAGETADCNADCTWSACGDGVLNLTAGETCDDGGDSATCDADCTPVECGDGLINSVVEECEEGGVDTSACDSDCTLAVCGDYYQNDLADEACDHGPDGSSSCDEDCTLVECGDGVVNPWSEGCEPFEAGVDDPFCNGNCTLSQCGDGYVNDASGETCDPGGWLLPTATCDEDCTPAECGDGVTNTTAGEECDGQPGCSATCTYSNCGDGELQSEDGEECDDAGESANCDIDCTAVVCGDGLANAAAGEACDDGGESASCDTDCTVAECGDEVTNKTAGEDCDSGGKLIPECDYDCTRPACGDGIVNPSVGEQCDDGNVDAGDGCSAACTVENGPGPGPIPDAAGGDDLGTDGPDGGPTGDNGSPSDVTPGGGTSDSGGASGCQSGGSRGDGPPVGLSLVMLLSVIGILARRRLWSTRLDPKPEK